MSVSACDSIRDDLVAYLDGELEPARAGVVGAHLEGRAPCSAEACGLEASWGALDHLPGLEPAPEFLSAVAARVLASAPADERSAPRAGRVVRFPAAFWAPAALAAGLLLTAGLSWFLSAPPPAGGPAPSGGGLAQRPQTPEVETERLPDSPEVEPDAPDMTAQQVPPAEVRLALVDSLDDLPPEEQEIVENLDLLVLLDEVEEQDVLGLLDLLEDIEEGELDDG